AAAAEVAAWLEAALLARAGGEIPDPAAGRGYVERLTAALPSPEAPDLKAVAAAVEPDTAGSGAPSPEEAADSAEADAPDPELAAIFREEFAGIVDDLQQQLVAWNQDLHDETALGEVRRAFHTLKGSGRVAGVEGIAEFAWRLEDLLNRVLSGRLAVAPPHRDLVAAALARLRGAVERLGRGEPVLDEALRDLMEWAGRAAEGEAVTVPEPQPGGTEEPEAAGDAETGPDSEPRGDVPETAAETGPAPATAGVDEDLVAVFLEEGAEQLEALAEAIRGLEGAPAESVDTAGLQRALHTLKGSARTAGAEGVGELAHAAETLAEALERGDVPLAEAGIPHLNAVLGRLEGMFAALQQGENPAALELVDRTRRLAGGEVAAAVREESGPGGGGVGDDGQRVRLPAAELERLAAAASEVGARGARLRQHLGRWRGSLEEVDRVIERVRDQIRRLDMETEAQIQARREELGSASSDFDPLEMDRFSNLQTLSRGLGESLSDLEALRASLGEELRHAEVDEARQRRAEQSVREGLARARVVPFSSRVPQLRHLVQRQAAAADRRAELRVEGADLALDRSLLGRLVGPLEHLLRNAVIHGIEAPEARRAAGKEETGRIDLAVSREGSELRLTVADDGAGLDPGAVAAVARERGEIGADETVTPARAARLILTPGLTTRPSVDRDAGRGVGLDAVNTEVKQLGGSLEVSSTPGEGTRFRLRVSLDIALQRVLFLQAGGHVYALPMAHVAGISQIPRERLETAEAAGEGLDWQGRLWSLHHLDDLVGLPRPAAVEDRVSLVLLEGVRPLAVAVEALAGQGEVVVRAGGPQVAALPGVIGATVLDDGRVAPLLDLHELEAVPQESARDARPQALVVDDSITVRRVTGRLLERHGWRVATARDGVEALEAVEAEPPAVVLLDIEMPRMDGFELLGRLRQRADGGPPVVMITSRSGDKHRRRAEALGVSAYLGKPWQEEELLTTLTEAAHGEG
ncbi:Hpt domain-containing protein, partial [Thiohalospira sp.]|uniref:hybrid sensor histidine kinase/response regulator n=1 Tax=Thiohalospira sp. TaxID=3080549 RepID=UPI00397F1280